MLRRCYRLSPRARLTTHAGRDYLVCDYPLHAVALNESARVLLERLRPGVSLDELVEPITPPVLAFLEARVAQGSLLAEYRLEPAADLPAFDVIVPVLDNPAGLARCLGALLAQDYPRDRFRVTVVDDASLVPQQWALGDEVKPLRPRWVRMDRNMGPASARNAGVAAIRALGEEPAGALAFTDSDCVPDPGWLRALAAMLDDPTLAAVGTQVVPLTRDGWLARYEGACSSLNLGSRAGPVAQPRTGHPYLPACNLAVRTAAFDAVGGFREGWRFGEDVDLCWRLHETGYRLFYHPAAPVAHEHRTRPAEFLQRKRLYARSEGPLRRVHPGRFRHRRDYGARAALAWVLLALATRPSLLLFAPLAFGPGLWALWRRRLDGPPVAIRVLGGALVRRAVAGLVQECRALTRHSLVLWLPLLAVLPRVWPLAAGVFALGAAGEALARRPGLRPWIFLAGFAAECLAYSLGKLEGEIRPARGSGRTLNAQGVRHSEAGTAQSPGGPDSARPG